MNEKEVMIEFQNRIDALETKIKEYKDFLFKVSILVLVLLGLTVFVASHVFWG